MAGTLPAIGPPMEKPRFILALDSLSGLAAGSITWILAPFLQTLHKWPGDFTYFIAFANIAYGLFSGTLFLISGKNSQRPLRLVAALVAANSVWAIQCCFQAWRLRNEASYSGLGHMVFEAVYVGLLAYAEAKIFLLPRRKTGV